MAPETDTTAETADTKKDGRGSRRHLVGVVTSNKMQKTVVVMVTRRVKDARFHKFLTRRTKYKAHDEKNECKIGDRVEIVESRPLSRDKRWRVSRLIERPVEA